MFKNYLKIAFRNLVRRKAYSFINVMGLAVGMTCFFIILSYVQNELSYDRFHEKRDQIYRLMRVEKIEGKMDASNYVPAPLAPALLNDFPEIIDAVRITGAGFVPVNHEDKSFVERRVLLADSSFFDIFTFPLVRGNPKTVLHDKYSVVITEEIAEKYFGDENPVGKTLTYDNRIDLKVTGVARNIPPNTDLRFNLVVPFVLINEIQGFNYLESWGAFNFTTFVLARQDISHSEFEGKSVSFGKKYRDAEAPEYELLHSLFLQPVTQIHLEPSVKLYIYIFSAVAIIILLLACINFMNLSLAQSSARAREVGLRKVIGASRIQLVRQFLGESIFLAFLAFPLAICMMELILPVYNRLLNLSLRINYLQNWLYSLGLLVTVLLVGVISSSYPAFYASGMRPIITLKSSFESGVKRTVLRNALVVFQFTVSIILIIGTIIIHDQLRFIKNTNLGFNKENLVDVFLYEKELMQNFENFKAELLKNPKIISASGNHFMSGGGNNSINWEERKEDDYRLMRWFRADPDFLETFEIELVEGRNFRKGSPSDVKFSYLLNESAVKALGWESAVGKRFELERYESEMGVVIGVVKDFHFDSLRRRIEPLAILMGASFRIISLRILQDDVPNTIGFVKEKLREFAPSAPFEYYFLDNNIDDMYRAEERMGKMFGHFSLLSIFIACMGLLGLTSFSVIQRTREIGIRKVLGASVSNIAVLLSKEFTKWAVMANIIAWPVAYFAMNLWLRNFAYRIGIGLGTFLLAAVMAFTIALITVSSLAIKAALADPADSLRYE